MQRPPTSIRVSFAASTPSAPGSPQLVAAIAADANGYDDRARAHFEIALRQANDLPLRMLQPGVRFWYGRMLARHTDPVEQSRGRELVEEAQADFRSLRMVLHADRALPAPVTLRGPGVNEEGNGGNRAAADPRASASTRPRIATLDHRS